MLLSSTLAVDVSYQFDDDNGFFDQQARRDVFEKAANDVLAQFADDLAEIDPTTDSDNTWKARFTDPGDNGGTPDDPTDDDKVEVPDPVIGANKVRIYAGGKDIQSLGRGGPGGFTGLSGSQSFVDTVQARGESGELDDPETDFGPWGGSITFDTNLDDNRSWHFGERTDDLGSDEFDFYSVAIHEMLHTLGFIEGSNSFGELITTDGSGDKFFTGPSAEAEYDDGGREVPLNGADGGHWKEGLDDQTRAGVDQETVMDPSTLIGARKDLTRLDLAAMDDLGWDLNNPPQISAPDTATTDEDTARVFSSGNGNPIAVNDPDAEGQDLQFGLAVDHGVLTLAQTTDVSVIAGADMSDAMTIEGSQSDINAALDGLEYAPDTNYNGPDTLSLSADDLGHTGTGGNKTDSASVDLTVNPVNDAPTAVDDGVTVDEDATGVDVTEALLANDTDPDASDVLSVSSVDGSQTTGAVALTNGAVVYDPSDEFESLGPDETATDTFGYTVSDDNGGTDAASVSVTIEGRAETFRILEVTGRADGFRARLSRAIDLSALNAFDGAAGPADVTVTAPSGDRVPGSLAWDADTRTLTFVAASAPLVPDGAYGLTVPSRDDGLVSETGMRLDGDPNATGREDFEGGFTVPPFSGSATLSLPGFARGPGQAVDVPASADGLPVRIGGAEGVTSVEATIRFDGSLLDVASVEAVATGWRVDDAQTRIGTDEVVVSATGDSLEAGPTRLLELAASIPSDASASEGLIQIASATADGGATDARGVSGVQRIALFGDADDDGNYSGFDASLVARTAVGLQSGFDAHPRVDARVVGDVDSDGSFSGFDASLVARQAVGLEVPEIPDPSTSESGSTSSVTAETTGALEPRIDSGLLASAASGVGADPAPGRSGISGRGPRPRPPVSGPFDDDLSDEWLFADDSD